MKQAAIEQRSAARTQGLLDAVEALEVFVGAVGGFVETLLGTVAEGRLEIAVPEAQPITSAMLSTEQTTPIQTATQSLCIRSSRRGRWRDTSSSRWWQHHCR